MTLMGLVGQLCAITTELANSIEKIKQCLELFVLREAPIDNSYL
jgi:hypothetical protein